MIQYNLFVRNIKTLTNISIFYNILVWPLRYHTCNIEWNLFNILVGLFLFIMYDHNMLTLICKINQSLKFNISKTLIKVELSFWKTCIQFDIELHHVFGYTILRLQGGSMMELGSWSSGGRMRPSQTLKRGRTVWLISTAIIQWRRQVKRY